MEVQCCLYTNLYSKKKRPCPKYIQSSYTKSIYKVHIYKAHLKSIVYTTYPPHLHKIFFNVCMVRQIESGDSMCWMNDKICLLYLRYRHCSYYFLYCLDVHFLQNRYYRSLNGHPNHKCAYVSNH